MNTTGTLLPYYFYYSYFTVLLLVLYLYLTRAALLSVSPINAGIRHAENAAQCTVARDVTEVTSSYLTVARPVITA
jgi:hypothetical protein